MTMKNLLRRLHIGASQDDHPDGGGTSVTSSSDSKPSSSLSGWFHVARNTLNQAGNSKHKKDDASDSRGDEKDDTDSRAGEEDENCTAMDGVSPTASSLAAPALARERRCSDSAVAASAGVATDAKGIAFERAQTAALQLASDQALFLQDEELQVRVAMALSVRDDPEAAAIETAKDLSLGSDPSLSNSTAEVLAYRYWKYNALNYDDKVVDGFYDVYGVASDSSSEMPALIDLQETPFVDQMTWEVVLVNRATDNDLVNLEQKAISIALSSRVSMAGGLKKSGLIHRIADMVADEMGGPVVDADLLHKMWRTNSTKLRLSVKNVVLPLGRLQIGLGRHRALLFKVLADAVGIPCQLVKGRHYTGSDEGAVNIIKVDDGREYIIDLMGAPGTLISSDVSGIVGAGSNVNLDQEDYVPSMLQIPDDAEYGFVAGRKVHRITRGGKEEILADLAPGPGLEKANVREVKPMERHQSECTELKEMHAIPSQPTVNRSASHWRSTSCTEGIGLPAVKDIKVEDVQYMMDAAKENPKLAQRLHEVLLESGVEAPPDLFSEISPKQLQAQTSEERKLLDESQGGKALKGNAGRRKEKNIVGPGRPPVPTPSYSSSSDEGGKDRLQRLNSVEGLRERWRLDPSNLNSSLSLSPSSSAASGAAVQSSSPVLPSTSAVSLVQENFPPELIKHVPVAAAAAATAAVVASSMMVVAAAKLDIVLNPTPEVPVAAAAATATAAMVVVTSAVVGRRLDLPFPEPVKEDDSEKGGREDINQRHKEADAHVKSPVGSGTEGQGSGGADKYPEDDRVLDKSSGPISGKSDRVLDDVAEWEIPWEELVIGERIGLGSYGEVYHADWHGTEVAVKKFLDQDISGDALEEFRSEVRLMKRMCHPNVVLFMGAVMRAPNLSIVTEFLPRGSLYRLMHRSNSQLDERRRMRIALDVARGMNYLHNSTPVIVHGDLKSHNLLVDKNWVVKVCDFGLSRLKHNTFLSSKSTTGTPEWMAPEVLRNEPSNEKSDVYSFGVILWELATLQQPWAGMNSMQVVGAVGFQHRILDIPEDLDPVIVKIIQQCWQSDPSARPSFAEIMAALKPLQKLFLHTQTAKA